MLLVGGVGRTRLEPDTMIYKIRHQIIRLLPHTSHAYFATHHIPVPARNTRICRTHLGAQEPQGRGARGGHAQARMLTYADGFCRMLTYADVC
jgi:hypothetical protein